jgi:hypothetical protein
VADISFGCLVITGNFAERCLFPKWNETMAGQVEAS